VCAACDMRRGCPNDVDFGSVVRELDAVALRNLAAGDAAR
jgi:hypothetical protein